MGLALGLVVGVDSKIVMTDTHRGLNVEISVFYFTVADCIHVHESSCIFTIPNRN